MEPIGCSITLTTNHRAESQCIVDNACRISRRQFPVVDPLRNFHMITLPNSKDEESLSNGQSVAVAVLMLRIEQIVVAGKISSRSFAEVNSTG